MKLHVQKAQDEVKKICNLKRIVNTSMTRKRVVVEMTEGDMSLKPLSNQHPCDPRKTKDDDKPVPQIQLRSSYRELFQVKLPSSLKMQYSYTASSRPASLSPKTTRRCSTAFVNDYSASAEANFAPAACHSDDECGGVPSRRVSKKTAMKLRSKRASRSKSPQPTRGGAPEEWVPFPALPRSFMRRVMTPPRARSPLVVKTFDEPQLISEKKKGDKKDVDKKKIKSTSENREKKEKSKKGFLSGLSDEKVPHEKRFKNRQLKNDYIKNKFSEMNRMESERTFMTDSSAGQSNPEGNLTEVALAGINHSYFLNEEDEDHFVEGLLMFAPERTIRELTKSEKAPTAA